MCAPALTMFLLICKYTEFKTILGTFSVPHISNNNSTTKAYKLSK